MDWWLLPLCLSLTKWIAHNWKTFTVFFICVRYRKLFGVSLKKNNTITVRNVQGLQLHKPTDKDWPFLSVLCVCSKLLLPNVKMLHEIDRFGSQYIRKIDFSNWKLESHCGSTNETKLTIPLFSEMMKTATRTMTTTKTKTTRRDTNG